MQSSKPSIPLVASIFSTILSVVSCAPTISVHTTDVNSIEWYSCPQNGTIAFTCGTLKVPLDYTNTSSNATLTLDLVKVSAVKEPKLGSILFNPGGPGDGGREFIVGSGYAEPVLVMTGGQYDLIGFDTRGTGRTIPFSCYTVPAERTLTQLITPSFSNASDTAVGTIWAYQNIFASNCYDNNKDTGSLLSTAFVARDMMRIVDALKEDGLLRYWGFSYGTALGETVAAMFPDRMDKVVLDGVLNPREWWAGTNIQESADTDATFLAMFKSCLANPSKCELSKDGTTALEIQQKVYDLLYKVKFQPIPFVAGNLLIDYITVKSVITSSLYSPALWSGLASALHGLLNGNLTPAVEFYSKNFAIPTPTVYTEYGPEAIWGIRCSDASIRTNNLSSLAPLISEFYSESELFGDIFTVQPLTCSQWLFTAKERYTGDFSCVKTKKPVLFVGNTYDPFTPLVSARNASAGFHGSVVLQHDGFGHTSLAQPSLCTAKYIRSYFINGTLPAPGTKCKPTIRLFDAQNITQTLESISSFNKRTLEEDDDLALMNAMMRMSHLVRRFAPYRG